MHKKYFHANLCEDLHAHTSFENAQAWRWQLLQQIQDHMNDEEGEELLLIGVVEMFAFDQVEGPRRHGNFAPKKLENWPRGW